MPKQKVNGVELHFEERGNPNKETIVFAHGYLMNHSMFDKQVEALEEQFHCIAYEHRGHGQSEVAPDGYALQNITQDAIAFIESLDKGPVHFVGMSTGGFVALRIALQRPDLIKSLVLMDTSAEEEHPKALRKNNLLLWVVKNIGWFPVQGAVMRIVFHNTFLKDKSRKTEAQRWRKIITGQDVKAMYPFGKGIFARGSVLDQLPQIQAPTLVIVGAHDRATPLEYNKRIAEHIPGAAFTVIPDSGHSCAIEQPDLVNEAMLAFYEGMGE